MTQESLSRAIVSLLCPILFQTSIFAAADTDWPGFRGPEGTGVADTATYPDQWSATENVAWKTDIPGRGWSSPIVSGKRIFLTTVVNLGQSEEPKKGLYLGGDRKEIQDSVHQWKVICLDLDSGAIVWEKQVHEGKPQGTVHIKNSYASETPVTDGERVYAYFGNLGIWCLDLEGNVVWTKEIAPHPMPSGWGTAASPVLHENRLYIVNDNQEDSCLLALDKLTGEEVWRVAREEKGNWATPFVWINDQRTEIVTNGTNAVRAYDLDGKLLWSLQGNSRITIGTPYASGGLLYLSSGYVLDKKRPVFAVKPGASGDISLAEGQTANDWVAWTQPQAAPYNPSTIVYDGRLYAILDAGMFSCYNATDGTPVYERQRIPEGKHFTASPWAAQGKIYCLDEDGVTHVVKAGDEFAVLRKNPLLEDDMGMATPAVAGDRLLIRTSARVYCIQKPL